MPDVNGEKKMTENAPMYLWATEMVGAYYERLDLAGKSVLTIAGSGDQVLSAVFFGTGEVFGFDINRNALFMTELKQAAILNLSHEEFLQYFQSDERGFAETLYRKFTHDLPADVRAYFDAAYVEVGPRGLGKSEYFRQRDSVVERNRLVLINPYLESEETYRSLKQRLMVKRPALFVGDVLNLEANGIVVSKKFDIINLSNVPNYLTGKSFRKSEEDVLAFLAGLCGFLALDGKLFFYSYDNAIYPNFIAPDIPPISRKSFLEKLEQSGSFVVEQKNFPGMLEGQIDRITILLKN